MIKPLIWEYPTGQDEAYTLFLPGIGKRSLRLTLYSQSFGHLNAAEQGAIELLREFGFLEEIDLLETDDAYPQYIRIPAFDPDQERLEVPYRTQKVEGVAFLSHIAQFPDIAATFLKLEDHNNPQVVKYTPELMLAQAHIQLRRDVLVTGSPFLLQHSAKSLLRRANVRTPLETIKIVGLLLRSRGNYVYRAMEKLRIGVGRGGFYWILMRHRLPRMWRYFSVCVRAEDIRRDGVLGLGESVLTRAERALQARDEIGIQYYLPPGGATIDEMLYHFDFLTIVLSGAFDAQARIAHRAYHIQRPNEYLVNFRVKPKNSAFFTALRRSGADQLVDYLEEPYNQGVIDLLFALRNTIHGENLRTMAIFDGSKADRSVLAIPEADQDAILNAMSRCKPAEDWGIVDMHIPCIEPYTCALKLVDESFRLINGIAELTEVERLFPDSVPIPELTIEPPNRDGFEEDTRRRLDLLG